MKSLRASRPARAGKLFRILLPALCALATFWLGTRASRLDRPWEKDEPIRLGETVFWRLLRAGDLQNPRWRDPMDASHPVMVKFVYGAILQGIGRDLPRDFSLLDYLLGGGNETRVPEPLSATYLALRRPARVISVAVNSAGIGAAAWLAFELGGGITATAFTVIILFHFVFRVLVAKIMSDPLEMTWMIVAGCCCYLWWRSRAAGGSSLWFGAAAGAASGAAFVTRLDGLMGFGSVALIILVRGLLPGSGSKRGALLFGSGVICAFLAVWIGLSPSYWPRNVGLLGFLWHLPGGVVGGLRAQIVSLRGQLEGVPPEWRLRSLGERAIFIASTLGSGKAGKLLAGGLLLLCFSPVRRTLDSSGLRFALVFAGSILLVFSVWLPVSWFPYVHHILPEAALLSALGWGGAFRAAADRLRPGRN